MKLFVKPNFAIDNIILTSLYLRFVLVLILFLIYNIKFIGNHENITFDHTEYLPSTEIELSAGLANDSELHIGIMENRSISNMSDITQLQTILTPETQMNNLESRI